MGITVALHQILLRVFHSSLLNASSSHRYRHGTLRLVLFSSLNSVDVYDLDTGQEVFQTVEMLV